MSNDHDDNEEKLDSFEFDEAGEVAGYISLDQARVLAMRSARAEPGEYGRFTQSPMAFEVVEEEETEDHYVVTLAFRPQGEYSGESGREQFFIEKEGAVAHRQVLELPKPTRTGRRFPVVLVGGILVVIIAVVAVVAVTASGIVGQSEKDVPEPTGAPVQTRTFPTPASAAPQLGTNPPTTPAPSPKIAPTSVSESTAQPTRIPIPKPRPIKIPVAQIATRTAPPEPTPTRAPSVQPQEPEFEFARAELPQFGFAFDYPSAWEVVSESEDEFAATAPNEGLEVLAEGQEFDGTLEQLVEDFLTTMDSDLHAFEIVDRSDRILRLGDPENGDQARGILIEFRYRNDDDRPGVGNALLGTREIDGVRMAVLLRYMSLESRSDIARRLFAVALDSLDLFHPEIARQSDEAPETDTQLFAGRVYSAWTDTSAEAHMELEEFDGQLVGYIDIEPPHIGSGDLEGEIVGNHVSFSVNFFDGGIEFNCVYEGTLSEEGDRASGEYMCANGSDVVVDRGSWEVSK